MLGDDRRLLHQALRVVSWNTQGLREVTKNSAVGGELLGNLRDLGEYDVLMLQEHKLFQDKTRFASKRIGAKKVFWTPAEMD